MIKLWDKKTNFKKFSSDCVRIADIIDGKKMYLPYERKYGVLNSNDLLRLIEDAANEKWEILDLSNTGISILPEQLFELKSLKVLFIGNIFYNQGEGSYNTIKEIPDSIQNLENLEVLSICGLGDVKISTFVKVLPRLVYVDYFKCILNKSTYNLFNKKIRALGIDCANEEILKRICLLKNIEELYLNGSPIRILPEDICNLKKLRLLSLSNSNISKIPNGMYILNKLKTFRIFNTPLINTVPEEIMKQSALEIVSYICRQQTEHRPYYLNESKMLIVGQGNVGKSCLLERICADNYEEKESTEGINIQKWTYTDNRKKNTYILNIWDFGGQEIYHSTHQFFLTNRSLYIFVWDARAEEEYGRIDYWLKTIESFAENSPIIIAINKCDYSTTRINRIDFGSYRQKYPQIKEIIEISCKDNINIKRLRNVVMKEAKQLPIMKIKWFYEWYEIRKRLEELSTTQNYISYSKFKEICQEYKVNDKERKSLEKYLHDLGIILHYEDDIVLNGIIILSPEWATNAVYKILDSQETILKNRNGILKMEDLPEIWKDEKIYPVDRYIFLLKIMEKFQLCFEISKGEYLVAELLENSALSLPDGWSFEVNDIIKIIYDYDFMPAGVMTRFIVSANQYLAADIHGKRLCWKKGAYLIYKNAFASVIMTDSISNKQIEIKVNKYRSANDAKELLHIIRQKLREINSTFKKLLVKEYVPCNCSKDCGYYYPYETLCMALEKGQNTIQCYHSFENVDILKLLEGIEIKNNLGGNSMYNINIENNPIVKSNVRIDTKSSQSSMQEQNSEVNIHTGLSELEGYLNELYEEINSCENKEIIEEIDQTNQALNSISEIDDKHEILKTGKINKLRRLIEGFASENGEYNKLLSGSKNIAKIVAGLVSKYNTIATAIGIETLPFL